MPKSGTIYKLKGKKFVNLIYFWFFTKIFGKYRNILISRIFVPPIYVSSARYWQSPNLKFQFSTFSKWGKFSFCNFQNSKFIRFLTFQNCKNSFQNPKFLLFLLNYSGSRDGTARIWTYANQMWNTLVLNMKTEDNQEPSKKNDLTQIQQVINYFILFL